MRVRDLDRNVRRDLIGAARVAAVALLVKGVGLLRSDDVATNHVDDVHRLEVAELALDLHHRSGTRRDDVPGRALDLVERVRLPAASAASVLLEPALDTDVILVGAGDGLVLFRRDRADVKADRKRTAREIREPRKSGFELRRLETLDRVLALLQRKTERKAVLVIVLQPDLCHRIGIPVGELLRAPPAEDVAVGFRHVVANRLPGRVESRDVPDAVDAVDVGDAAPEHLHRPRLRRASGVGREDARVGRDLLADLRRERLSLRRVASLDSRLEVAEVLPPLVEVCEP